MIQRLVRTHWRILFAAATAGSVTAYLVMPGKSTPAPVVSGQAHTIVVVGAGQSNNWSGYSQGSMEQQGATFHQVSADWTVPTAVQREAGQAEWSSTWVGIGGGCVDSACGLTDGTLIQAGTEQDVSADGRASYTVFYELIPSSSVTVAGLAVHPGDRVHVDLDEANAGSEAWTISIEDLTTGKSISVDQTYPSSYATVEWVEETPLLNDSDGGATVGPLPQLSAVDLSNAQANGAPAQLASSERVQLLDLQGHVLSTPSDPTPDASGFTTCSYARTCAVGGNAPAATPTPLPARPTTPRALPSATPRPTVAPTPVGLATIHPRPEVEAPPAPVITPRPAPTAPAVPPVAPPAIKPVIVAPTAPTPQPTLPASASTHPPDASAWHVATAAGAASTHPPDAVAQPEFPAVDVASTHPPDAVAWVTTPATGVATTHPPDAEDRSDWATADALGAATTHPPDAVDRSDWGTADTTSAPAPVAPQPPAPAATPGPASSTPATTQRSTTGATAPKPAPQPAGPQPTAPQQQPAPPPTQSPQPSPSPSPSPSPTPGPLPLLPPEPPPLNTPTTTTTSI